MKTALVSFVDSVVSRWAKVSRYVIWDGFLWLGDYVDGDHILMRTDQEWRDLSEYDSVMISAHTMHHVNYMAQRLDRRCTIGGTATNLPQCAQVAASAGARLVRGIAGNPDADRPRVYWHGAFDPGMWMASVGAGWGCAWGKCSFCDRVCRHANGLRPLDKVLSAIEQMQDAFCIHLGIDGNNRAVEEILAAVPRGGPMVSTYWIGSRCDTRRLVSRRSLDDVACNMGLESLSDRPAYRRPASVKDVVWCARLLLEAGAHVQLMVMPNSYDENKTEARSTITSVAALLAKYPHTLLISWVSPALWQSPADVPSGRYVRAGVTIKSAGGFYALPTPSSRRAWRDAAGAWGIAVDDNWLPPEMAVALAAEAARAC